MVLGDTNGNCSTKWHKFDTSKLAGLPHAIDNGLERMCTLCAPHADGVSALEMAETLMLTIGSSPPTWTCQAFAASTDAKGPKAEIQIRLKAFHPSGFVVKHLLLPVFLSSKAWYKWFSLS